jgi:alpha-1,6-mannosyltransferase
MSRIVHLANFFGPRSGGLRTTMLRLADGYVAAGHDVHIVVPAQPSGWIPETRATVHSLASLRIPRSGGYRIVLSTRSIRQLLDEIRPDIVELSDRLTLMSAARWARHNDVPCTLFAHERIDGVLAQHSPHLPGRTIADLMNMRIAIEVDRIVTTTSFAAAEFDRLGIPTIHVPLGVDTDLFYPLSERPKGPGPIRLVMCSRLSSEKHPERAIEVLESGCRMGRNWHLTVIGDGPRMRRMRTRAAHLPVMFTGFLSSSNDVARVLQSSDVALAPGPIETFGLAALEALSCGTPVICSERSALREIIGGAGFAVGDDVGAWTRAVDRLSHPSHDGFRGLARDRALEFPWRRTIDHMLRIHRLATSPMEAVIFTEVGRKAA